MSMWRPRFLKCMILDHKLQRMLNDSKIGQLNSERPLHQTAVCQVTAIMSLFVERPVASLWRRDAKAGVGLGRKVQVDSEKFRAHKASKGTSYLFRCVIGYGKHAGWWSLLCFIGPTQKLQI